MRRKAVVYLVYSQLAFIVTILICAILEPSVIANSGAFSTFGTLTTSFLAYVCGLLVVAGLLVLAARSLPRVSSTDRKLVFIFYAMALILVGLAFTPYTLSPVHYRLHGLFAMSLYVVELAAGVWLIRRAGLELIDGGLYAAIVAGQIITILSTSEVDIIRWMTLGQFLVIFSFAGLISRTVTRIEHVEIVDSSPKL